MRNAMRLGKIYGIEIRLDYSWFVVFALVTWSLSAHYFQMGGQWTSATSIMVGVLTSVLFFAGVLAHELGHSFVAVRRNVPVRSITLFIFGGLAEISKEPEHPRDEFQIAVAGPVVSACLGLLFLLLSAVIGNPRQPIGALSEWLGSINLSLAAFNLIPGFPLDGGRILRSIVWARTNDFKRATEIASRSGQYFAYGFILLGVLSVMAGGFAAGLWIALIGWFLNNAAIANYQQVEIKDMLSGVTARAVMITDCRRVSCSVSLERLVYDYLLRDATRCLPVVENGRVYGIVTLHNVKAYPPDKWPSLTAGQVMTPFDQMTKIGPDQDLFDVMKRMADEDINQAPVVQNGHFLGMISRDQLLNFIALRTELGFKARAA